MWLQQASPRGCLFWWGPPFPSMGKPGGGPKGRSRFVCSAPSTFQLGFLVAFPANTVFSVSFKIAHALGPGLCLPDAKVLPWDWRFPSLLQVLSRSRMTFCCWNEGQSMHVWICPMFLSWTGGESPEERAWDCLGARRSFVILFPPLASSTAFSSLQPHPYLFPSKYRTLLWARCWSNNTRGRESTCYFFPLQVSSLARKDGGAWAISHVLPLELFEDGLSVIFSAHILSLHLKSLSGSLEPVYLEAFLSV